MAVAAQCDRKLFVQFTWLLQVDSAGDPHLHAAPTLLGFARLLAEPKYNDSWDSMDRLSRARLAERCRDFARSTPEAVVRKLFK